MAPKQSSAFVTARKGFCYLKIKHGGRQHRDDARPYRDQLGVDLSGMICAFDEAIETAADTDRPERLRAGIFREDVGCSAEALDAIPQHAVDPDLNQPGSALAGVARHVIQALQ